MTAAVDTDLWRDHAACTQLDPERFVTTDSRNPKLRAADLADKQHIANTWCATCPARQACAEFADSHQYVGLWGGSLRTHNTNDGYNTTPLIGRNTP